MKRWFEDASIQWKLTALMAGTIGLVQEGDSITVDANQLLIQLNVDESEIARRRAAWGILILTALDLITHAPRQNPLLADRELLAKPSVQINPVPKFGRSRAMISHSAQVWLSRREMPEAPGLHWEQMQKGSTGGPLSTVFEIVAMLSRIRHIGGSYNR